MSHRRRPLICSLKWANLDFLNEMLVVLQVGAFRNSRRIIDQNQSISFWYRSTIWMEHIPHGDSLNARAAWNLILWGRLDLWPPYLTLYSEFAEVRHAHILSGISTWLVLHGLIWERTDENSMHVPGDVYMNRLFFFPPRWLDCHRINALMHTEMLQIDFWQKKSKLCWWIMNALMNLSLCQMSIIVCSRG